jgi:putative ABC transport system substrate-binding protein
MTGFGGVGDVSGKRIGLFKELVPGLQRLLTFINPKDPASAGPLEDLRVTTEHLKIAVEKYQVESQGQIEQVFKSLNRAKGDGVFVLSPSLNTNFLSLFVRLAAEGRLPLAGFRKEWVEQGALFSYSHDLASFGAPAAQYVDRILKGDKPADLPFQDASSFQFIINLKTANVLGLTIPPNVLVRANRVIR